MERTDIKTSEEQQLRVPLLSGNEDERGIIGKFLFFTGMGAVGTLVHYLVLLGLVELFGSGPVMASAFAFCTGALVNYYLNYHLTFRSDKPHREAMIKFFTVAAGGLLLNTAIMAVATKALMLHYLLSQIIATGVVLLWNFTGNLLWTFGRRKAHG